MAELAMLADIQRIVYPKESNRKLHIVAQARECLPVIDRRTNHCATPPTKESKGRYGSCLEAGETVILCETHVISECFIERSS